MRFERTLQRGRLIKRYKRFLADVALAGGAVVTASCPNTGSMMGLSDPGMAVWLSESDSRTRKYRHTLELVEAGTDQEPVLVGINTNHPNKLVAEAISASEIDELTGYAKLRREVRYGKSSRIDLLLEDPIKGLAYVEIKNVHLMRTPGRAEFPDSVTERGTKHLDELSAMVAEGHRAVMLYLVQRADAESFSIAADVDPTYAETFARATGAGVEALAYRCRLSPDEITLERRIAIKV